MKWEKLGHVFTASGEFPWAKSHAYIPVPLLVSKQILRIYFACLDKDRRGTVNFVEVDAANPTRILNFSREPALGLGQIGAFDQDGVTPTSILIEENEILLFYFGWPILITSFPSGK